jgi:hypothetical protein
VWSPWGWEITRASTRERSARRTPTFEAKMSAFVPVSKRIVFCVPSTKHAKPQSAPQSGRAAVLS